MKPLNKQMMILAAIALGLVFSGTANAKMSEEEAGQPNKDKRDQVIRQLNLTPQQEAQIKQLQMLNRQKAKELFLRLKEKRKELVDELDKARSSPIKIRALIAELKDIQGRLIEQRVDGVLKMKEILTPEQYQKFSETLKNMHKSNFELKKGGHWERY